MSAVHIRHLKLKIWGWKPNATTGIIEYTKVADDDMGFDTTDTIVDGGEVIGSQRDNTTPGYHGYIVQLEVKHDVGGLADGNFEIYADESMDTGEGQSDASGYSGDAADHGLRTTGPLIWESNGLDDDVMRSRCYKM